MQDLNEALFLLINAPANPNTTLLLIARLCAEQLIWVVPASLLLGWFMGNGSIRQRMLEAGASGLLGVLMAQLIGLVWMHPRPFAMGLGHQWIAHAADASFPSDHLTLLWSVAFSLLLHPAVRRLGVALALLGLPMAWARIYVGVHFPLDMLGAAVVAGLAAWLAVRTRHGYMPHAYGAASAVHRALLGPLIGRGWVRP